MDASVVRRGLGGLIILLVVTALFAIAFVDGGASSHYGTRVPFRLIASTTEDAGSARVELRGDAGSTFGAISGQGAFDFRRRVGQMTITSSRFSVEERLLGDTVYVKIPSGVAPVATPWLSISLPAGSSANGLATLSPSAVLDALRTVGDVERVGTDTIRGAATTHYRAIATQQPRGAVDVWTDADGRLRRLEYGASTGATAGGNGAGANGAGATPQITLDVFDYGADVGRVDAPPADQVTQLPALFSAAH